MENKNIVIGLLITLVIAIIALFTPYGQSGHTIVDTMVGGVTNYDEVDATAIKIGGTNGSRVGPIIAGTCDLIGLNVAQAASTTRPYDCAVTGIVSGDTVLYAESTTTQTFASNFAPFRIVSAKASTTAGFITFGVQNIGGGSQIPGNSAGVGTGFGSSTNYTILHPVASVPGL